MCLSVKRIYHENLATPLTAKEPILVFKELRIKNVFEEPEGCGYITPYRGAEVVFNDGKCKMGDGKMAGDIVVCANALDVYEPHKYAMLKFFGVWENGKLEVFKDGDKFKENEPDFVYIQKGIHAYFKCPWTPITESYVFKPAIIPPGANYFVGDNWDIVSDEMIVYLNDYEYQKDYPDAKTMPLVHSES